MPEQSNTKQLKGKQPVSERPEAGRKRKFPFPFTQREVTSLARTQREVTSLVRTQREVAGSARTQGEIAGSAGTQGEIAGSAGTQREVAGSAGTQGEIAGSAGTQGEIAGSAGRGPFQVSADDDLGLEGRVFSFESFPDENSPLFNPVWDELTAEIALLSLERFNHDRPDHDRLNLGKTFQGDGDDENATSDNQEVDGNNEDQIPDNMDLDGNSSATTANNLAAPDDNIDLDDGVPYNDEFLDDGLVPPRLHPNLQQFLNSAATELDRVARAFYYVARFGPIPCTGKFHKRTMESRGCSPAGPYGNACEAPHHYGLGYTCRVPKTRGTHHHDVGLDKSVTSNRLRDVPRSCFTDELQLKRQFSGLLLRDEEDKARICLGREDVGGASQLEVRFDVDSHIQLLESLADLRCDLKYVGVRQPLRQLTRSVHISHDASGLSLPLHRIPHVYFGFVEFGDVYLMLPEMYEDTYDVRPTDKMQEVIYDSIVRKAVEEKSPDQMAPWPKSYHSLLATAKARTMEHQGNNVATGTPYYIGVPREILGSIQRGFESFRDDSSGLNTRNSFFLLDAKNTKTRYGGHQSISEVLRRFWTGHPMRTTRTGGEVREPEGTNQFLDVAAQWSSTDQRVIALVRQCCWRNTMLFLCGSPRTAMEGRDHRTGSSRAHFDDKMVAQPIQDFTRLLSTPHPVITQYPLHQLNDSATFTTEPRQGSLLYRAGIRYMQTYSTSKMLFDAGGIYSFDLDNLVYLGFDEKGYKSLVATHTGLTADRQRLLNALEAARKRVFYALQEHTDGASGRRKLTRYPWRFEFRANAPFLRKLGEAEAAWAAMEQEQWGSGATSPQQDPPRTHIPGYAFYNVDNSKYLRFLRGNVDKYFKALEMIRVQHVTIPSTHNTRMLYATLMTCLRNFVSCIHPRHQPFMLNDIDVWEKGQFQNSHPNGLQGYRAMLTRGYAFLPPSIVDWERFSINDDFMQHFRHPLFSAIKPSVGLLQWDDPARWLSSTLKNLEKAVKAVDFKAESDISINRALSRVALIEYWILIFLCKAWRREMSKKLFLGQGKGDNDSSENAARMRRLIEADAIFYSYYGLAVKHGNDFPLGCTPLTGNRSKMGPYPMTFARWIWGEVDSQMDPAVPSSRAVHVTEYYGLYSQVRAAISAMDVAWFTASIFLERLLSFFWRAHSFVPWPDVNNGVLVDAQKNTRKRLLICVDLGRGGSPYWVRKPCDVKEVNRELRSYICLPKVDEMEVKLESVNADRYIQARAVDLKTREKEQRCRKESDDWE